MKKYLLFFFLLFFFRSIAQNINTVAGNGVIGFSGDGGSATTASLFSPYGVAIDTSGNLYISDSNNSRIRMVNTAGIITTIAGNGSYGFGGDGGPAVLAKISYPAGLAVDLKGNLFIADKHNNRVRKVSVSGIITTVAGNGMAGMSGDGGLATGAKLDSLTGVAVDLKGNLFISDYKNHRIRKVDTSGIITTVAGNGQTGFSGDGGLATLAELDYPQQVAADKYGSIYIADGSNRIRKVSASGIINTIAGNGSYGYSGDGGLAISASMKTPYGIAIDTFGNLFFSDAVNSRIRKIDTAGIITTVAGNGIAGFSGDGGAAVSARLDIPFCISLSRAGNLYIGDYGNDRIRIVNYISDVSWNAAMHPELKVYPNPSNGSFCINLNSREVQNVKICDLNGSMLFNGQCNMKIEIEENFLNNGIYILVVTGNYGSISRKIVVAK